MRLDDLWILKVVRDHTCTHTHTQQEHSSSLPSLCTQLVRSSREQILRKAKLLIRQQHYQELAQSDPIAAISFLQTDLSSLVNHDDPLEREQVSRSCGAST